VNYYFLQCKDAAYTYSQQLQKMIFSYKNGLKNKVISYFKTS